MNENIIEITHNPDGELSGFSVKCPAPEHKGCKFCNGSGEMSFMTEASDGVAGQPAFTRFVSNWSRRVD